MALNEKTRTENASRNTIVAVVNKIIILVLTFVGRKFFIEYIGVGYLGINGLFSNVLTLLSMADLGIGTAMNVSLYKPIAENDTKKLTAIICCFRKLYYIIAAAITIIGLGLMPFLKYIINMEQHIPHLYLYYIIFVIKNAISYLFIYKASIIYADQKNSMIDKIDIYINIIKTIIQITLVIILKSYLVYILLDVIYVLVKNIVISITANREYPFINNKEKISVEEKKVIFSDIFSVFLYKVSYSLINGTDNILMSLLVGTISVGLYSNYFAISNNLESFLALIFMSLTASVGSLVASSSPENRFKVFKSMQMASFWLSGFVCVCLLFLLEDFIQLWIGKEMLLDKLTLFAVVLNLFFATCMRPVWIFREGTGMYKQIRYIMMATAVLNLGLSIVLGKWLGISGILYATALSKLLTYFWYEPNVLYKKFFNESPWKYYKDYVINILVMLIGVAICWVPIHLISEVNIFTWLLKAVICTFVMNGLYLCIYRKAPELDYIKEKLKSFRR